MNTLRRVLTIVLGLFGVAGSVDGPNALDADPASHISTTQDDTHASVWQEGTHFDLLDTAEPNTRGGKIRVVEFFWYGCGHCYDLEPHLERWKDSKPNYIEFVRVPTLGRPVSRAHARLYYTLIALGRENLHARVFDAIHQGREGLFSPTDETETLRLQTAFAVRHGISARAFASAYYSPTVEASLQQADALRRRYRVIGVPTLVVNGKYLTSSGRAGGSKNLIAIVSELAGRERTR